MIGTWLHSLLRIPSAYQKFDLFDIDEHQTLTTEMERYLEKLLLEARLNTDMLKEAAKILGWTRIQELLVAPTQPKRSNKRAGDFGEVLTNALLAEIYGYIIPVQKIQFGVSAEQSQPGTDTIAIKKKEGAITEICYVESKLRTKNDSFSCLAAVQGYQQLKTDYSDKVPDMISFVLARLYDKQDLLFYDFLNYINKRQDLTSIDRFRIGLVWEHSTWQEKPLELLEDEVEGSTPKLSVHRVRIRELKSIVEKLYENMGVDVINDE
jgi:hypothetical protein